MKRLLVSCATALALLGSMALASEAVDPFPMIETETAYLERCERELLEANPAATSWAPAECHSRWQAVGAAGPMAAALLTLSRSGIPSPLSGADVRTLLTTVQWSSAETGTLGDLSVTLSAVTPPAIAFAWYEIGAYGRYHLIDALRSRGATLRTLGCPQYPGASMGQEKVLRVDTADGATFAISVYSRGAPTAIEPGIYEVNADFSGVIPTREGLQSGSYPGGGGRAFAVDATGWVFECADPE